ncbi:MAG: thermonuclease family protein [Variibacter sp.]
MTKIGANRHRLPGAAAAALLTCAALWTSAGIAATITDACGLTPLPSGQVRDVVDGRTLRLRDGREVRLAAIDVPPIETPRGREAQLFLAALLTGQTVSLKAARSGVQDRYGRLVVYVFTADEGLERSLQAVMLEGGLARVAARVGSYGCASAFWAREQNARTARRGLWADRETIVPAQSTATLLERRGRPVLVEGTVISVRESGGTIYVNFGRRWSEDFTVTIAKRNARIFAAAGVAPKQLARQRVRVRGVVEERGGPWIEALRPEQIEVLEHRAEKWDPDVRQAQQPL